jgi:hypothetical protein
MGDARRQQSKSRLLFLLNQQCLRFLQLLGPAGDPLFQLQLVLTQFIIQS